MKNPPISGVALEQQSKEIDHRSNEAENYVSEKFTFDQREYMAKFHTKSTKGYFNLR
jgi:hypothetical protein